MTNDCTGDNKNDALRQTLINPPQSSPVPLPEHNDVTIPVPMTPSEFEDRIFGSSPLFRYPIPPSSLLIDALSQNPSPSFSDSTDFFLPLVDPTVPARLHRSKTAPLIAAINDVSPPNDQQTEQSYSKPIVRRPVALLVVYFSSGVLISLGVLIYWLNRDDYNVNQTHPVVDALYFCIVTMCTIGYGDITPDSVLTKMFSILVVLVGFCFMNLLINGTDRLVNYVLDRQSYILENGRNDSMDVNKGRMKIKLKVGLALGVVVLCLGFGVLLMHFVEKIGWFDSFYLSAMSITTVGYGERAFNTMLGRLLAAIWLLVSTIAIVLAILYLAEARVDKRNRERAKKVLGENMSLSQFLDADTDNNGCVSKAEYVIYKLKMMEKITDEDINLIGKEFDKLDRTNRGRIILVDFFETSV